MKIAAIIPVKTFSKAKTRLNLSPHQVEELCKVMLEEILQTLSISPQIEKTVMVTREEKAIEIGKKFNAVIIIDEKEQSVNSAVSLADKYLLENNFDVSIVFPQDIPFIKTQDIDFMLNYKMHPNFAIIVPSRRFDGTNALARMPVDLMETHYDEDSYKIHMNTAKNHTLNVAMVFVKRIMWDVDNVEDLKFLLEQNEKPEISEKIRKILESN
ncbi:MAG: 2-phospho-L-lactate guanylyltransferase [Nitrosopumilus sp.]|nr:2-phospho-L-lactate guanylyltransferase [Nitrosopumilus sp.]MDF2422847.1 2-phospho-L-lactate guanylyltransferase [Nitrosopumilus sp.]MDF2424428.1 2-phospho-L-lactate guanylyltransferase [Nitrosopumilus sp.]MDF2425118.1 2-phospho-L-lactate guanylyltransferase [Nitrosopumilus sp.]MDF2427283.1 2-phospho-L-lactate guanylyltransferase [Nitrosopumilus sp.]